MKGQILVLVFAIVCSGCTSLDSTRKTDAKVLEVVDGDTVEVKFNSRKEAIRLEGIDTPEVNTENKPYDFEGVKNSRAGRNCLKNYGLNASRYVKEKIANSTIQLEYRTGLIGDKRGDYGRLLGAIYYEGNRSMNIELVQKGLARSYKEDGSYFQEEVEAKLEMRGVWNCQRIG